MAYSVIPAPGRKYGPCKTECKHLDCAEARANVKKLCPKCEKEIGYNTEFTEINSRLFHLLCAWDYEQKDNA